MHCDTSTRPVFDLTQHRHPRAVHAEILRFVRGIRSRRENPVSRAQIAAWMRRTPAEAVDAALAELVAEGRINVGATSLRTASNSHRRAYGYEVAP
jgi:hypothetical protein